jgi:hypothetical protein
MDSVASRRLSPGQALKDVLGLSTAAPVGDPFRASFRRKSLRHGAFAGVLSAAAMHVSTIVFLLIARGKSDVPFAFLWSVWFALPEFLLHAAGALIIGMALSVIGLIASALLFGLVGNAGVRVVMLAALLGVLAAVSAALLNVQNPLRAGVDGPAALLTALIPAAGGAVWGALLARRSNDYFARRAGGVAHA